MLANEPVQLVCTRAADIGVAPALAQVCCTAWGGRARSVQSAEGCVPGVVSALLHSHGSDSSSTVGSERGVLDVAGAAVGVEVAPRGFALNAETAVTAETPRRDSAFDSASRSSASDGRSNPSSSPPPPAPSLPGILKAWFTVLNPMTPRTRFRAFIAILARRSCSFREGRDLMYLPRRTRCAP